MESDMYIYIGTGGRVPKGQFSLGVARRGLLWSGGWGGRVCFVLLVPTPEEERVLFIGTPSVTLALGAFTATTVL